MPSSLPISTRTIPDAPDIVDRMARGVPSPDLSTYADLRCVLLGCDTVWLADALEKDIPDGQDAEATSRAACDAHEALVDLVMDHCDHFALKSALL